jgi:hypothetical protein
MSKHVFFSPSDAADFSAAAPDIDRFPADRRLRREPWLLMAANVGHEATASMKSVSLHEANVRSHLGHLKQSLMTRRFPVRFPTST